MLIKISIESKKKFTVSSLNKVLFKGFITFLFSSLPNFLLLREKRREVVSKCLLKLLRKFSLLQKYFKFS